MPDEPFESADKEVRVPQLALGDLIQDDAYDEYVTAHSVRCSVADLSRASFVFNTYFLQFALRHRRTFILRWLTFTIFLLPYGRCQIQSLQAPELNVRHKARPASPLANST